MAPRLLIASGIFHPEAGGPATYLYEILPALQQRGWEIETLAYGDAPTSGYPYPLTRIPRRALPLRLGQYARAARPMLRRADLIYIHTLGLPLVGGAAPRVFKIVGDQAWERAIRRGWIPPTEDIDTFQTRTDYGPLVTLQKRLRAREVRQADGVIVPSEYLKRMVAGWGVPAGKIHVIYNALPTMPEAAALSQAEARALLGLDDGPLMLTAARLNPWKGVDHLIAALAHVPEVRLWIAGDGPERRALEQQAHDAGLAERVNFLGQVAHEQMAHYMKAADYLALYSGYEGLSHTLLESLSSGTPVIASDKGGNPEIVTHDVNGLLVPYIDVEALIEALRMALQPGKRAALAAHTSTGMARFDFTRMVDETDTLLRSCLL